MSKENEYSDSLFDPMGLNPEVQAAARVTGKVACKIFEATSGMRDPTGQVSEAAAQFAQAAAPYAIGASRRMMEVAYAMNETPAQIMMREYPMRTEDGTPITIEEGRKLALAEIEDQQQSGQSEADEQQQPSRSEVDEQQQSSRSEVDEQQQSSQPEADKYGVVQSEQKCQENTGYSDGIKR